MPLTVVMYHYVRYLKRSRYPSIKGLDTAQFREQLKFLTANFTVVRMEEVLEALDSARLAKRDVTHTHNLPDNATLLTFDDGYIDHYTTVFPILDSMGLQGSFFPPSFVLEEGRLLDVNKIHFILASSDSGEIYNALIKEIDSHRGHEFDVPDTKALVDQYAVSSRLDTAEVIFIKRMLQTVLPVRMRELIADRLFRRFVGVSEAAFAYELYCSAQQLRAMKRHGMFIGLHGASHGWLGNMAQDEYERDITLALDYMDTAGLVDKNAWVMCYPYGSHNAGVLEYIRANGCQLGLTTEVRAADLAKDDRLLLPRLDTNDFPPKSEEYLKYGRIKGGQNGNL